MRGLLSVPVALAVAGLLGSALLSAPAEAQEAGQEGGRDGGKARPVVFVRCAKTNESKAIYLAAWQALEPFTNMTRRRLVTLPLEDAPARKVLAPHADAGLFVALDHAAAALVRRLRPQASVLEASPHDGADVRTRTDRAALADLIRRIAPKARRVHAVAVLRSQARNDDGAEKRQPEDKRAEAPALPAFERATTNADVLWIPEGAVVPTRIDVPLVVTTSPSVPQGVAVLTVRPDPIGAGLQLAARVAAEVRGKKNAKPEPTRVQRLHVTVDLRVAKRRGVVVPLAVLARADEVRRDS